MDKNKTLDFSGHNIYCAVDVHKNNWRVNNRDKDFELADYSQDPYPQNLYKQLTDRYPAAKYMIIYEAGFCGFGIPRSLSKYDDVDCIVVNAADKHHLSRIRICVATAKKICKRCRLALSCCAFF